MCDLKDKSRAENDEVMNAINNGNSNKPKVIYSSTEATFDPGADSVASMHEIRVHDEPKNSTKRLPEDTSVHQWGKI